VVRWRTPLRVLPKSGATWSRERIASVGGCEVARAWAVGGLGVASVAVVMAFPVSVVSG